MNMSISGTRDERISIVCFDATTQICAPKIIFRKNYKLDESKSVNLFKEEAFTSETGTLSSKNYFTKLGI